MDTQQVIIILVLVAIAIVVVTKWSVNHFRRLGNAYQLDQGGEREETQDECLLGFPSYRMCMMTDGTPGVCMLSGQCTPDIMGDLRTIRDQLDLPYCTKPIW